MIKKHFISKSRICDFKNPRHRIFDLGSLSDFANSSKIDRAAFLVDSTPNLLEFLNARTYLGPFNNAL